MLSGNENNNPALSDDLNTDESSGSVKDFDANDESSASDHSQTSEADYVPEQDNLEKMILSTGIRVGTPVKTKYMMPFIIRANPEGLYILDISKTLSRIDIAAKFISRADISKVAVTSAREYGKTPVEKFSDLTHAKYILGRFMPGTFTNPALPKDMEPQIVIGTDPEADQQAVL